MASDLPVNNKGIINQSNSLRILLAIVLLILALGFFISRDMDKFREFILQSGWLGLGFSVLLYGVMGASPIPSEPFTVLITGIYGPLAATGVATTGNVIAAMLEFYIGTKIGDVVSFEKRRAKLPFGLGKFPVDSIPFLLFARMIPGYGSKFVSVVGGMYRVSLWRYFYTAVISNLVGAAIFSFGGYELLTLIRNYFIH